jgi:hypothetical protein
MSVARVTVFGGCNIRGPLYRAVHPQLRAPEGNWDDVPSNLAIAGAPYMIYTFGEMLQTIHCYQGGRSIPPELHPLCNIREGFAPEPTNNPLLRVDALIIEPATSMEIEFDGYYLNRAPLLSMLNPVKQAGQPARRLIARWYNKGLVAMDDDARRETAEQLIQYVPESAGEDRAKRKWIGRELTIELLRGARGRKTDVRTGMARVVREAGLPTGVVLYTWAFMPDGRGIGWPADFLPKVKAAAAELGLPVFDPRPMVQEAGTATALKADLRHYQDAFMPVVAKHLVEFAVATADKASSAEPVEAEPSRKQAAAVSVA